MATRSTIDQIAFRRPADSTTGVTRHMAKRLAEHLALHEMEVKLLPQYEADDAPLTAAQMRQIKKRAPQGMKQSVRSKTQAAQSSILLALEEASGRARRPNCKGHLAATDGGGGH